MTHQMIDLFEFYHLMGHMSNSEKALAEKSCPIDDRRSDKLIIDQTWFTIDHWSLIINLKNDQWSILKVIDQKKKVFLKLFYEYLKT